ncbi:hypothetical protein BASA61_010550 [Batrachochytrium salamandrivorans]|nr:hypothetical protein BASA61_010550 [Batrachochytrium salamandrivorans]
MQRLPAHHNKSTRASTVSTQSPPMILERLKDADGTQAISSRRIPRKPRLNFANMPSESLDRITQLVQTTDEQRAIISKLLAENRTLNIVNFRQERAIQRLDTNRSDMPQVINSMSEELRVAKASIRLTNIEKARHLSKIISLEKTSQQQSEEIHRLHEKIKLLKTRLQIRNTSGIVDLQANSNFQDNNLVETNDFIKSLKGQTCDFENESCVDTFLTNLKKDNPVNVPSHAKPEISSLIPRQHDKKKPNISIANHCSTNPNSLEYNVDRRDVGTILCHFSTQDEASRSERLSGEERDHLSPLAEPNNTSPLHHTGIDPKAMPTVRAGRVYSPLPKEAEVCKNDHAKTDANDFRNGRLEIPTKDPLRKVEPEKNSIHKPAMGLSKSKYPANQPLVSSGDSAIASPVCKDRFEEKSAIPLKHPTSVQHNSIAPSSSPPSIANLESMPYSMVGEYEYDIPLLPSNLSECILNDLSKLHLLSEKADYAGATHEDIPHISSRASNYSDDFS